MHTHPFRPCAALPAILAASLLLAADLPRASGGVLDGAYAAVLDTLSEARTRQKNYPSALALSREAARVREATYPAGHWQIRYSKALLALAEKVAALTPMQQTEFDTAYRDLDRASRPAPKGVPDTRLAAARRGAAVMAKLFGKDNLHSAFGEYWAGIRCQERQDLPGAKAHLIEAVRVTDAVVGGDHPDSPPYLTALADVCAAALDVDGAERAYRDALHARERMYGGDDWRAAVGHNNIGVWYRSRGDTGRAEPHLLRAVEILGAVAARSGTDVDRSRAAMALHNLGAMYTDLSDFGKAEKQFMAVLSALPTSPEHALDRANLRNAMGSMKLRQQDVKSAVRWLEEAVKGCRDEKHTGSIYQNALTNLAVAYTQLGKREEAEAQLQKCKDALGGQPSLSAATVIHNLGVLRAAGGNFADADRLIAEADAMFLSVVGSVHPEYGMMLGGQAVVSLLRRDWDAARERLTKSIRHIERSAEVASWTLSERRQLAMAAAVRHPLDMLLSLAAHTGHPPGEVYDHVLAVKGSTFARQRAIRLARESADPETTRLADELQGVANRLAGQYWSGNPDPAARKRLEFLSSRQEALEQQLTRRVAGVFTPTARRTAADIRAVLPAGVALIDYLEYTGENFTDWGKTPPERRLTAFVVRAGLPVRRVDLGPAAAVEKAAGEWLAMVIGYQTRPYDTALAARLRELVWQPLAPHLDGARVVLVSPDGPVSHLPFAALPGDARPYLAQERLIATVPVPRLLPELLAPVAPPESEGLLLVDRVDLDAPPGKPAAGAPRGPAFRPRIGEFPPTADGVTGDIRALFSATRRGDVRVLEGAAATEQAWRERGGAFGYVHVTAHGFFERPGPARREAAALPNTLAAGVGLLTPRDERVLPRGLQSGLALAGANRGGAVEAGEDDGVLTAAEVAHQDLRRTQHMTLAACLAGRGELVGGEGMFSLQRAFHLAGVRTVLAPVWQVEGTVTGRMMSAYYHHLWKDGVPPLEALRRVQLSMIERTTAGECDHPYYWAGWLLSGAPGDLTLLLADRPAPAPPAPELAPTSTHFVREQPGGVRWPLVAATVVPVIGLLVIVRRYLRRDQRGKAPRL